MKKFIGIVQELLGSQKPIIGANDKFGNPIKSAKDIVGLLIPYQYVEDYSDEFDGSYMKFKGFTWVVFMFNSKTGHIWFSDTHRWVAFSEDILERYVMYTATTMYHVSRFYGDTHIPMWEHHRMLTSSELDYLLENHRLNVKTYQEDMASWDEVCHRPDKSEYALQDIDIKWLKTVDVRQLIMTEETAE